MSRFWAAGGSSSDSDTNSDDSSVASSSEESAVAAGRNENRWVFDSDSDSDESEVREVKSGKDRAIETLKGHVKGIKLGRKNRNYVDIQTEFKAMEKCLTKNLKVLGGVPRSYIRCLVELQDDFLPSQLADKKHLKKISAFQGRALNWLKLTLSKQTKTYGKLMDNFRANPIYSDVEDDNDSDSEEEDDSDDDDSDDDSDDSDVKVTKKEAHAVVSSSESDSSDDSDSNSDSDSDSDSDSGSGSEDEDESGSEWGESSESSSSSSEDDEDDKYAQLKGRSRWLKSNTVVKEKVKKDKDGPQKESKLQQKAKENQFGKQKTTKALIVGEINPTILQQKVTSVLSQRGRRGTNPKFNLRQLQGLSKLSVPYGPRTEIPLLMHVIAAQFDLIRTLDDTMDTISWKSCASNLSRVTNVITTEGYTLGAPSIEDDNEEEEKASGLMKFKTNGPSALDLATKEEALVNPHTGEEETKLERLERLRLEKEAAMTKEELMVIPVVGSLSLMVHRLEEEYTKSLQKTSPHSAAYVTRLKDEASLLKIIQSCQEYFSRTEQWKEAADMAQLRIEHLYYRHDTIAIQVDRASKFYETYGATLHPSCLGTSLEETSSPSQDPTKFHPGAMLGKPSVVDDPTISTNHNYKEMMDDLCGLVYKHGSDRSKTRAMLCQIYHNALHDRFLEARDLLLMSHLQETIAQVGDDVSTMILFNRMMATMGLAAFRLGKIWDAHQCLSDICSGRVRELLAQGVSTGRYSDKTPDQERAEKRRQTPYHLHIHLELLEACHLISAMLLEVPHMVVRRARVISRSFRKYYDMYDRQVFVGPPEQTREFVMVATKSLMKGDWQTCSNLLCSLDVWKLVPGDNAVTQIQSMLQEKIKLEGLRTYLFAFSSQYDSMSLNALVEMFDLSKTQVHSVISKMLMNKDIYASWDQPTETIVLRHSEPSSLQLLALQFADKAANLVEANERLLDAKSGTNFSMSSMNNNNSNSNTHNQGRGGHHKDNRHHRNSNYRNNHHNNNRSGGTYRRSNHRNNNYRNNRK